jgi:hypothetical protein
MMMSEMSREPHPIEAAERRKILATGVSPWLMWFKQVSPVGAKESTESVAPTVLMLFSPENHGLAPVAKIFRRSAAQQGRE